MVRPGYGDILSRYLAGMSVDAKNIVREILSDQPDEFQVAVEAAHSLGGYFGSAGLLHERWREEHEHWRGWCRV